MRDVQPVVEIVETGSIKVGDRFRKDYGDIEEFKKSILENGIIQPLAVSIDRTDEKGYTTYNLLAGGRRIKAAREIGIVKVPVRVYPKDVTKLEMREIELSENIDRKDLDWVERNKLENNIHELMIEKHGEKDSTSPTAEGWSLRDTAKKLDVSPGGLSRDLELHKTMELFPSLAEAKNKTEALKMMDVIKEAAIKEELSRRLEDKRAKSPLETIQKELSSMYIVGDMFESMKDIPTGSINFIELDPPYAVDLKNVKRTYSAKTQLNMENYTEVAVGEYQEFMKRVMSECYRVLMNDSFIMCWHGMEWYEMVRIAMEKAGFTMTKLPAIWTKKQAQNAQPTLQMGNCYEPFLYGRKGHPIIVKQGRVNNFIFKQVYNKDHPTEKPIELYEEILRVFCQQGDRVVSPFLGSGNVILAGGNLGMTVFGFDLSSVYKDSFVIKVFEDKPGEYKSYR